MSGTELLQIDAFTATPFGGNPAAVCLMDHMAPTAWMQRVAAEMNLSETAFVVPRDDGAFDLRWFTPTVEVPLCGHATLASAHALWETGRCPPGQPIRFHTLCGELSAQRDGRGIAIDLPAMELQDAVPPDEALEALGVEPLCCVRTRERGSGDHDWLLELADERAVRRVRPDFAALQDALRAGVIVTARSAGGDVDFVSRFFAPAWGVDEDPVTGVAHCALAPYWCPRLGREELVGFQASPRGGRVGVRFVNDGRVTLRGPAVTVLRGELVVATAAAPVASG
ncbi:MAG: PhzF family phenazine biosynthesis protein [Planctomycetota bacterium]|jgi:PhzF family phenazine biosynthesis protein